MTWNKDLSLLPQNCSVNATRNNDSRNPEAIATHRVQQALALPHHSDLLGVVVCNFWSIKHSLSYQKLSGNQSEYLSMYISMHCSTGYYFLYMQGQNFSNFTLIFQLLQSQPHSTHRLFFFHSSLLPFLSLFALNTYYFTVLHPHLLSPHHKDSLSHLYQAERDSIPLSTVCCSFLASLLFIYS